MWVLIGLVFGCFVEVSFHNGIILIVICFQIVFQIYELDKPKTIDHEKNFRTGFRNQ